MSRDMTKTTCVLSEDSDQPGHPPSLIRVFAVHMKKALVLSYPLSAQWRLIRLGGCSGWSESSLGGRTVTLLVLSCRGSYYYNFIGCWSCFWCYTVWCITENVSIFQYLAPEVLRKQPYDKTVDWWCLGAVLYEMMYGLVSMTYVEWG